MGNYDCDNRIRTLFWSGVELIKNNFAKQPEEFLALKDKFKGQKCFIVATGPSLTLDDLELIKGQYSFGVNSIINSFDKTSWRPNFYVVSDIDAYKNYGKQVEREAAFEHVFYPVWMDNDARNTHYVNNKAQFHFANVIEKYRRRIYPSKKLEKYVVDAPSVVFTVIQIAIFLGFKTIYLLGQDCNYKGAKQHSEIADLGTVVFNDHSTGDRMIDVFYNYAEALKDSDVKIYNCTRGGMLEAFKRVALEEAIKSE